jgi:hypothetical protein
MSNVLALANVESSNVMQFDVYRDLDTGERYFKATSSTYEISLSGRILQTPLKVYTDNPRYNLVIYPRR